MYLLDTNVVSELRRPRPHGAVLDWIAKVPAEQLFVSAVTVGEIQAGIEITREQDDVKAESWRSGWTKSWLPTVYCLWTRPPSGSGHGSCTGSRTLSPKTR